MSKKLSWIFVLVPLSLLLTGCPSAQFKQGEVQKKWSESLRQLGIVPIFPPREDLFVGDVYVSSYDPESESSRDIFNKDYDDLASDEKAVRLSIGMNSRLYRINLADILQDEYSDTLSAPPSTADYNAILGNPALAAIDTKIAAQKAVVDSLKKKVSDAVKAESDAATALKDATRAKADADTEVSEATKALNEAKTRTTNVSAEKAQLAQLKAEKRGIEDEVKKAARALEDAPTDNNDPARIAAQAQKKSADRKLEDHNTKISRLEEDVRVKEAIAVDTSLEAAALKTATDNQNNTQEALLQATRDKEDATEKKTKVETESAPKIVEEEGKLTQLGELKASIQAAGAKHLYSQPQYSDRDIFSGTDANLATDDDGKPIPNDRISRMRLVGFPEFASTSISQGDLSALIPTEGLAANITASKVGSVVVKVPAAESYGVSFLSFYNKMFIRKSDGLQKPGDKRTIHYYDFNDTYKDVLVETAYMQAGADEDNKSRYLYFRFITEVFYARAIDVSVLGSGGFQGSCRL